MKILMIVTEGDLGGAQRHVIDISTELIRRGDTVVVAYGGERSEIQVAADRAHIETIKLKYLTRPLNFRFDVQAMLEIFLLVRRFKPDIVHCHSSKAGILASIAGRLAGAHVVYTAHGFVFREELRPRLRSFYEWAERIASWFRHKVVAVSHSDAEAARFRKIVKAKKITVIPNGIDERLYEQLLEPEVARATIAEWAGKKLDGKKIVISIANFYPVKNIPLLVRSFEYVVPREPDAVLVLVGDGAERSICEKIVAHAPELQDRVFFVGKQFDAFRVLRGADVLAITSTKEGMPYVVLEAKMAGTPIVASRVGGIPEMSDGDIRLVVPHSAEMLSDAIVDMLRSEQRADGRPLKPQFTLSGMVDALQGVYKEVLSN